MAAHEITPNEQTSTPYVIHTLTSNFSPPPGLMHHSQRTMDQDFGGPRQFTDGNESVELALRTLVDWLLRSKLDRNTYHYESVKTLRYALKNATYPKVMSFTDALGPIPSPNTLSQNQVPESRNCVIFTTPSECRDLLSRAPLTLPVYLPDGNIPASRVTLQQCFNFLADRFHDIPGICYMDVLSCPRPSPPSVGSRE